MSQQLTTTYEDREKERQKEVNRRLLGIVHEQSLEAGRHAQPPKEPPPPSPPGPDASARDFLNWWRYKVGVADVYSNYLFIAIGKMLDTNDDLRARVAQLEAERLVDAQV